MPAPEANPAKPCPRGFIALNSLAGTHASTPEPTDELADLFGSELRLSTRAAYLETVIILTLTSGLADDPAHGQPPTENVVHFHM